MISFLSSISFAFFLWSACYTVFVLLAALVLWGLHRLEKRYQSRLEDRVEYALRVYDTAMRQPLPAPTDRPDCHYYSGGTPLHCAVNPGGDCSTCIDYLPAYATTSAIRVRITQTFIRLGRPHDPYGCPICLALKQQFNTTEVFVQFAQAEVRCYNETLHFRLTPELWSWVQRFDAGRPVMPIQLEVNLATKVIGLAK